MAPKARRESLLDVSLTGAAAKRTVSPLPGAQIPAVPPAPVKFVKTGGVAKSNKVAKLLSGHVKALSSSAISLEWTD